MTALEQGWNRGHAARREKGGEGCGRCTLVALSLSLRAPPALCRSPSSRWGLPQGYSSPSL